MKTFLAIAPIFLIIVLALYIYAMQKKSPEVYLPAKEGEVVVQYPRWVIYFSLTLLFLGAVFFFLVILFPDIFGDESSIFTLTFLSAFFYIGGFFVALDAFLSRLRLLGEHIVYTTAFGTKKEYDFSDILYIRIRISPTESRGVAYGKNYKKLFNFSSILINTHLVVEAFEEHNIPLEPEKRRFH